MPVMRGDEATIAIRKLERADTATLPIIAMTANALESDVENSFKSGMNGHISKPIEPQEVYGCLNKWLAG
jgi:CheY-like chemotaxis protein